LSVLIRSSLTSKKVDFVGHGGTYQHSGG
jgi:hypothetical protein